MKIKNELLPDVFLIECPEFKDERGSLRKMYHSLTFDSMGLDFQPKEQFISRSKMNVLRGMHYQTGASAQSKLVSCLHGTIIDVVVDIRPSSPNFNQPVSFMLDADDAHSILIGKGYAHGFLSLANDNLVHYTTTTIHNPSLDAGVLWSSIAYEWPIKSPICSTRDCHHPRIEDLR